jgi:hypothetical protein
MMERRSHHPPLAERFAPPPPEAVDPTPAEAMAARAGGRDPGRYRSASSGVAWKSFGSFGPPRFKRKGCRVVSSA